VNNREILRVLGRNIRQARLKASLTQECLAELTGVHVQTIGAIEHGDFPFAVTTFARLSQFLEISPNRLLDGLKPPDPARTTRIKRALARRRAPHQKDIK
jgi:transcriptional regulator with XRE-family HTH domain